MTVVGGMVRGSRAGAGRGARKSAGGREMDRAAGLVIEAVLRTAEGRSALERVGAAGVHRQAVVLLMRAVVEREAERRGLKVGRGRGASWLWTEAAAPDLHRVRLRGVDQRAALEAAGPVEDWRDLGAMYEALLGLSAGVVDGGVLLRRAAGSARRASGSYYTPAAVVEHLLDRALEPALAGARGRAALGVRVCDPACGAGSFLVPALERVARAAGGEPGRGELRSALASVRGVDIDPVAADLCRVALWMRVGDPDLTIAEAGTGIRAADALLADWAALFPDDAGRGYDAVVGNPPFLSQLSARTAHDRERAAALRARFGAAVRPYTDPAALFLLLGVHLVRDGGRVALVLPQSVLASRDAAGVREEVAAAGAVESLWVAGERVFDAGVLVCAPTVHRGGVRGAVRVLRSASFRDVGEVAWTREDAAGTWAPLAAAAMGVPGLPALRGWRLGDYATATADFRDQYYGLRGMVVEDASLGGTDQGRFAPLVTSGLIDPGVCLWGRAAARFDGRKYEAPRVDLDALERTDLAAWSRARRVPKVLLATQTPVLEAAVDETGDWLPAVPVITVVPRRAAWLWHVGAVLNAPVASAWALTRFGGAGLSASAIKLSAAQTLEIPVPAMGADWDAAAGLLREAARSGADRGALLVESARLMCRAYGIPEAEAEALVAWWRRRARLDR